MTRFTLAFCLTIAALPAAAADLATGDSIRAAIIGNTVQGSMSDATAYTEFYAADGVIKGKDYAGQWTIEGDMMCFAYDAPATCYGVSIAGDQVTWIADAVDAGTGTILQGNPNGY